MKKILINIGIFITFFIFYFLQTNFFNWFNIAGISPNIFIILILFVGLFTTRVTGVVIGATCGVLIDLFVGKTIGITGIMLGLVGFLGSQFDKNFSKDSKLTILFMVIGVTIVFEFGKYLLGMIFFHYSLEIVAFLKILGVELVYQVLITIILYPIMKKIGYAIEDEYKGKNILTSYF